VAQDNTEKVRIIQIPFFSSRGHATSFRKENQKRTQSREGAKNPQGFCLR